jgi:hypothetical protein
MPVISSRARDLGLGEVVALTSSTTNVAASNRLAVDVGLDNFRDGTSNKAANRRSRLQILKGA